MPDDMPNDEDGSIPPSPPETGTGTAVLQAQRLPSDTKNWLRLRSVWRALTVNQRAERKLVRSITEIVPVENSDDLGRKSQETDLLLKRWLSVKIVRWMGRQLVVANILFVLYAWLGREWDVPAPAISAWLGATVVEIIGIVYIIARYLFPSDGPKLGNK